MNAQSGAEKPTRKPNRIKRYDYSRNGAYFVTICTHERKRILSEVIVGTLSRSVPTVSNEDPEGCAVMTQLLWHGQIAEKILRQMDAFYENISVDKFVIMPDHIHLIISMQGERPQTDVSVRTSALARFVGTFKRFCNREYGENIWQSRFYDHVIRNQQDYEEIWTYIDHNPKKWAMEKGMLDE